MKPLVIDIETYYDSEYSLSKKGMTTERYIRDPRFKVHGAGVKVGYGPARWVTGEKLPMLLAQIPWNKVALIGHNLQFDATILAWRYGCVPAMYIDTLGMSRALVGQHTARHGLHYVSPLVVKHEGHPLHKMDGLAQARGYRQLSPTQEQILADYTVKEPHYNPKTGLWEAGDAVLTWELFKRFAPHLPKFEYKVLDWTIRKFALPTLYLDTDLLKEYLEWVRDEKLLVVEDVYHSFMAAGEEVRYFKHDESHCIFRAYNLDPLADGTVDEIDRDGYINLRKEGWSADRLEPHQFEELRKILASAQKYATALEALGVTPPTKFNAKGKITFAFAKTDAEHKALLEHPDPKVQALVSARMQVKSTIEETRAEAYLDASERGEWPVAYNYSGAVNTHRFSGNKGGGGNPMNLKRGGTLRKAIYAPHGKILLVFDLSQIECRFALWFGTLSSKSKGMEREALDLMGEGDRLRLQGLDDSKSDLYSYFAGMMFGREIIKARDPNERQIGKSAVLGLGFGMGAGRFQDYAEIMGAKGVDAQLAESTVHLYRNTYSGVRAMWRTVEQAMKAAVTNGEQWTIGPIEVVKDPLFGSWSFATEGGLLIKYPDLAWDAEGEGTYRDGNNRVKIFGGKFYENIIQHVARNILTERMMEIQEKYEVAMTTYDELVMVVDEDEASIAEAIQFALAILTKEHPMFPGLPIGVEWGHAKEYGNAKN